MKKYYLPAIAAMLAAQAAHAATFAVTRGHVEGMIDISVAGSLEQGDGEIFARIAERIPRGAGNVFFSSPGGSLDAGLAIGDIVRKRDFGTAVLYGDECSSACAYAWLAGDPRALSSHSYVGFHAASLKDTGEVSSGGNAIIGAYLNELGFNRATIRYMTTPSPRSIQWLNVEDAQKYGIEIDIIEE
jgi:hypothetical protein